MEDILLNMKPTKNFLVCVDSDGCVFDNMELKHKECFCPATVNVWGLQSVSRYAREAAEFVNLYSKTRGANRFPALIRTLELLAERDAGMSSQRTFAAVTGQGQAAASAEPTAPKGAAALGLTNAEMRELKKLVASLNRKIATAGRKVDEKQAEMKAADPTDFVKLGELQAELDELRAAKEALEDEWLEAADKLGEI